MGAATTLLFSGIDNKLSAICCDSSFSNLKELIYEFINKFKVAYYNNLLYIIT